MDNLQSVECEGALQAALSPDGSLICLARVGANGAAVVKTSSAFVAEIEGTAQHSVAAASWSHDGLRVACGGAAPAPPEPPPAPPASPTCAMRPRARTRAAADTDDEHATPPVGTRGWYGARPYLHSASCVGSPWGGRTGTRKTGTPLHGGGMPGVDLPPTSGVCAHAGEMSHT